MDKSCDNCLYEDYDERYEPCDYCIRCKEYKDKWKPKEVKE